MNIDNNSEVHDYRTSISPKSLRKRKESDELLKRSVDRKEEMLKTKQIEIEALKKVKFLNLNSSNFLILIF